MHNKNGLNMIDTIFILFACFYLFYKSYKKKDNKPLYLGILLFLFQLCKWPFYIPISVSLGLQAICAGSLVFYEYYIKRKDKLAITFCILFVGFGVIFLFQAIPINHPIVYKVITKVREIANK